MKNRRKNCSRNRTKKHTDAIESEINQKLDDAIRRGEIDPNDKDAIQKFLNEE